VRQYFGRVVVATCAFVTDRLVKSCNSRGGMLPMQQQASHRLFGEKLSDSSNVSNVEVTGFNNVVDMFSKRQCTVKITSRDRTWEDMFMSRKCQGNDGVILRPGDFSKQIWWTPFFQN